MLREVHNIVVFFLRQAASHVSWPDSGEEKGDSKGRLKQTSLTVWLVEMEDVQDSARHLQVQETQKLKNICPFLDISDSFCLESLFFFLSTIIEPSGFKFCFWLLVILKCQIISNIPFLYLSSLTVNSLHMKPPLSCFSGSIGTLLFRTVITLTYNAIVRSDDFISALFHPTCGSSHKVSVFQENCFFFGKGQQSEG